MRGAIKRLQHSLVRDGARHLGVDLSATAVEKLVDYAAMLTHANKRFNLLSRREMESDVLLERHLLDSLRAVEHLSGPRMADVGSGAGLPGVPLAIACPDLQIRLIDRSARRCDFLKHVKIRLGLDNVEIEEADVGAGLMSAEFNTAVARALVRPRQALALLMPLVTESGRIVLYLGRHPFDPREGTGRKSIILLRPMNAPDRGV